MRHEYDNYLYDETIPFLELNPFLDYESFVQKKMIKHILSDKDQLQIASQSARFLKEIVIRNGLKLAVRNNLGLYASCKSLKADTEKLIKFIDKDIK